MTKRVVIVFAHLPMHTVYISFVTTQYKCTVYCYCHAGCHDQIEQGWICGGQQNSASKPC